MSSPAKRGKGRGRGRPKCKKEEICEDYCFSCKDGGLLLVCDFKHCIKAYHPHCVGKDEQFIETGKRWVCNRHSCFICSKSSALDCLVCPSSVCKRCIKSAEFVHIRGKKGICNNCLRLAILVEEKVEVDSDGGKIDFKDRSTYEFLFKEYWEIINEKEGLTLEDLHSAENLLKKGQSFQNGSDSDKFLEGEEEDQDFHESMDDKGDTEPCSYVGKELKFFSPRSNSRRGKQKKRQFIGWGSKSLREFLKSIGKDSDNAISQHEVQGIFNNYIKENNLTDLEKKKKVLCDENLQSVFGKKSVNRNKIYDLLEHHLAENLEQSEEEEWSCHSDENEDITPATCKRQRRTSMSGRTDVKEKVLEKPRSCFAAVTAENIKLVYLRRSLVEDILKDPDIFVDKVMGSFVRVKSDPNDYFQKNAYQLLQVTGITKSRGVDKTTEEVTLDVSNLKKDIQICMLSDEDFSEEEIEDLHHRVKEGALKRLTVVELEQKARSLHEDLTKHWIKRELLRLQNLSDRANERGWRKELEDYLDRKQLLETSSEQQRLIQEVPKVIAEEIELEVEVPIAVDEETKLNDIPMDLPKDENAVKHNSPRSILLSSFSAAADDIAGAENAINANMEVLVGLSAVDVNGEDTDRQVKKKRVEGIDDANCASADVEVKTDLSVKAAKKVEGIEVGVSVNADIKLMPDFPIIEVTGADTKIAAEKIEGTGAVLAELKWDKNGKDGGIEKVVIELDSDDDDDIQVEESNSSAIWYYVDPHGCKQGPFTMAQLSRWSDLGFFDSEPNFKVWKTGQEAILLVDALKKGTY